MLDRRDVIRNLGYVVEFDGRRLVIFEQQQVGQRGLRALDLRGQEGFLADVHVEEQMRGHLDSHADLNVDANLIGRPALWHDLEPAAGQFNPTTWTPLPILLSAVRTLAADLEKAGLDATIMDLLGLPEEALAELSDTAFGFVDSAAETTDQLAKVTVRGCRDCGLHICGVQHVRGLDVRSIFCTASHLVGPVGARERFADLAHARLPTVSSVRRTAFRASTTL